MPFLEVAYSAIFFSDVLVISTADPNEGSVEYRGVDIRSLNIKWYRDQIGR